MIFRIAVFTLFSALLMPGPLRSEDLSRYRNFQLGAALADVAGQAGLNPGDAKLVSNRPERIEDLDWRAPWTPSSAPGGDSVREILFRFFKGNLFEMTVTYDKERTGGLTDADLVEALSGIYGHPAKTVVKEMNFNSGYDTNVRVVARWQDTDNVVSLVRLRDGGGYGAVISSARNAGLAGRAIVESERLDRVEAPQRELARQKKESAEAQVKDDKSRIANKPGFRP